MDSRSQKRCFCNFENQRDTGYSSQPENQIKVKDIVARAQRQKEQDEGSFEGQIVDLEVQNFQALNNNHFNKKSFRERSTSRDSMR